MQSYSSNVIFNVILKLKGNQVLGRRWYTMLTGCGGGVFKNPHQWKSKQKVEWVDLESMYTF